MNRLANRYSYILADLVFFEVRQDVVVNTYTMAFNIMKGQRKLFAIKKGFERVLIVGAL